MKYLVATFLTLACLAFGGGVVRADVNDFVIDRFNADYVLDNKAPGGSLLTTETIDVVFSDNNHGILRALPKSYQGKPTKINVNKVERDGREEPYSSYTENDNLVLQIGDADSTVTGKQRYVITYSQERVVNFVGGVPEFYWDINGDQWKQPFLFVTGSLKVVPNTLSNTGQVACYTGPAGATTGRGNCDISYNPGSGEYQFSTTKVLNAGETLTVGISLDGIAFAPVTFKDRLLDFKRDAVGMVIGLVLAGYAFVSWMKNGKDYPGRKIVVPEYVAPKGLTPAEVGMLADYRVDGKDLSATLIDLAVRGYVKIHEDVKKILFVTTRSYSLELLKPDYTKLKAHEKGLLEGIFTTHTQGEMMQLNKLNRTLMYGKVQSARKDIKSSLQDTYGYLESKSTTKMSIFMTVGFVLFIGAFFVYSFLGAGGVIGLLIGAGGFLAFGSAMQRRSHAGVDMLEKILGLKLYMNVAEKERFKMMQSADRPYAEPTKTPELYEKLLPYAVALGVEKSWSKQFDGILTQTPGWVASNAGVAAFSSAQLGSSISSITTSFSSSFQASSGSSGSSGGGSSGGGGGGGGGGW